MDLREIIARNLYAWNEIVGPGGHGKVSFDDAREHYGDFIDKHFEEADELIAAMLHEDNEWRRVPDEETAPVTKQDQQSENT